MKMSMYSGLGRVTISIEDIVIRLENRSGSLVHVRAKQLGRPYEVLDLGTDIYGPEPENRRRRRIQKILEQSGLSAAMSSILVDRLMEEAWVGEEEVA